MQDQPMIPQTHHQYTAVCSGYGEVACMLMYDTICKLEHAKLLIR